MSWSPPRNPAKRRVVRCSAGSLFLAGPRKRRPREKAFPDGSTARDRRPAGHFHTRHPAARRSAAAFVSARASGSQAALLHRVETAHVLRAALRVAWCLPADATRESESNLTPLARGSSARIFDGRLCRAPRVRSRSRRFVFTNAPANAECHLRTQPRGWDPTPSVAVSTAGATSDRRLHYRPTSAGPLAVIHIPSPI